jgi:hypothetical protein
VVVGILLSEAAGVGVTVAVSDDELFEITAIAKTKIPRTTAITIAFDEPALLLLLEDLAEYELPDEGFGVVEIVETEDLDEPLIGTAGIE